MGRNALFGVGLVVAASLAVAACGTEVAVPLPAKFQQLTVGVAHTCGILTDGTAYCWGNNEAGQLGDGSTKDRAYPTLVLGSVKFTMLVAGGEHTCGIATSGAAYCWGLNLSGQLGDETHTNRTSPTAVEGGLSFVTLSAGGSYSCGLTADGTAYCWGWNQFQQLGDSGSVDQSAPKAVAGGLKFASINGNTFHTCAVTAAGAAYCWGKNDHGQLGTGDIANQPGPVAVTGGLTFTSVEAGYTHTCGVTLAGAGYCWGRNQTGQLGAGDSVGGQDQYKPIPIAGGLQWGMISSGAYFTCGIEVASGGSAYCWGINQSGQLGANSTTTCFDENGNPYQCSLSPLAVGGGLAFSEVMASTQHTCGLTTDGVAYCWGLNSYGQLGNGEKGDQLYSIDPVKVGGQP